MSKITFGTDGWRGLIAKDFTFDNVNLVSKALAFYVKDNYRNKPVIIGYDTRFLADKFANEIAKVITDFGFNVLMSDSFIPTPVIAFAAKYYNSAGAIMVTASHNPPEYCGIKYIPDYAGPATNDITSEIIANINLLQDGSLEFKEAKEKGKIEFFNPKKEYFESLKKVLDMDKFSKLNLKVSYDPLYATGIGYFDEFLKLNSQCELFVINNHRDVLFGGGMPEPSEKYLNNLKDLVLKSKSNCGFSNDGDSDRFGVIDENGHYYNPNQVISLLLRHLVKNRKFKGAVVRTVATTHLLDKLANHFEINLIETPVGFKYVGERMRETEVIIGGEESGGLSILGHIPEKDGILANLLILEMLSYENKTLSQIWYDLVSEVGYKPYNKRLDIHLTEERKKIIMNKFKNSTPDKMSNLNVIGVKTIDGVKLLLEDNHSWVLIRSSGTEPLIRVYLESDSQEKLIKLQEYMETLLNE
ncbi:MAG: phosphoglucomutase [Candidatus Sericytochromatia bacterium]|nr:MAG: phosphoglucomutase [Candidatus Sericytochromatia bacterium]